MAARPETAGISRYGPMQGSTGAPVMTTGMIMYFALGCIDRRSRPTKRAMVRMSFFLIVAPLMVDDDLLDCRGRELDVGAESGGVGGADDAVEVALTAAKAP